MLTVSAVFIVTAVALGLATRMENAGGLTMVLMVGVPYAALALFTVVRMARDGELGARLQPRGGDLALGAGSATILYLAGFAVRAYVAVPGSLAERWIMRVYLQIGDPRMHQQYWMWLTPFVLAVAACEEIVWRGLVVSTLADRFGSRRAWWLAVGLYAAAHIPTMFTLRSPGDAPNPLVVVAALGCGVVWGLIARLTGRLSIGTFSHALFTWAIALQFPLWRLG